MASSGNFSQAIMHHAFNIKAYANVFSALANQERLSISDGFLLFPAALLPG
jgi:hypothetical protein